MPMEAMIRAPKGTPTATPAATPVFIPVDCEDSLLVPLEAEPAVERVLVEEGLVDVEEVSVDDSEDIDGLADGDTVSVSVTVSVHASFSFVDFVAVTVTMLCELALIALDR